MPERTCAISPTGQAASLAVREPRLRAVSGLLRMSRTGEPSFGIVDFCVRGKSALDRDDAAIANANIR
jgi:hypothetical protein